MDLEAFVTRGLGDSTYLIGSAGEAVVVDPQRDADRFVEAAEARGWRVVGVLETHVHNDYLSGALEIRARTGATIAAPARGGYAFDHRPVDDADEVTAGGLRFVARATPGHTPEHISWDVIEDGSAPVAVLTGGSLLAGSVGRTDLLGDDRADELNAAQFATLRRLASLPQGVRVLPTHGVGSFCMAGPPVRDRVSTIGIELARNPFLTIDDEATFSAALRHGLGRFPAYYAHMGPINRAGPILLDPQRRRPSSLDPASVDDAVAAGAAVVDARDRSVFAAGHLPGSLNVELDDSFASYVGWLVPFGTPLVLVLPEPLSDAGPEAVVQLSRIGYDDVRGALEGGVEAWQGSGRPVRSYETTSAASVAEADERGEAGELLDVRQPIEWRDEGSVPGAHQIFVADLPDRLDELPHDRRITVFCKSGSRSAIAASILDRAGFEVLLVTEGGASAWRRRAAAAGAPA